ncbi:ankyrin repeat domain-containing protein 26-like isoform X1 [Odocoileus virginianus]|uniref:Ankyrin repeat domain-containing protein 26-like isoform X1 n=1 Tax=Odocoileus virginianus TaxID=9874 RepID=A0ABM4H3Z4_ODOVR
MELRTKDLGSELSKMKTFEDSNKAELEKYKQHYLEELKVRKSLEKKLDKTNERLAEMSTELEVEKQQNRSLLSTLRSTPFLEPSSVGNFNPTSGFNANLISGANVGFSTSIPHRSNDSVETYLTKVKQRQRKELESVQHSEHPFQAHLGPQHPASLLRLTSRNLRTVLWLCFHHRLVLPPQMKTVGLWSQVRGLCGLLYISFCDSVTSGI